MKTYLVQARLKYPSCYNSGYDFEIHAATKADAIRHARRAAYTEGHTRQDGPLTYTAHEQGA